ncbi:MAG: MFS transporter, partial [Candidatus Latescibacteria bacterium]|nr:MFS transporter [Candidatus Latescibacterota bacterium]
MTVSQRSRFQIVRGLLFLLLTFTYILVFFHRMSPGAISDNLMDAFNISGAQLGSLAAIYFLVYSFMQIPSGVLADTLGMRTSMIIGNFSAGVGSLIFGLADSFVMASVGRLFVGLGVSVIFISILKFNSLWFS